MSFSHEIRVGGSYSLETHIRFRPPFRIQFMKLTKKTQAPVFSRENLKTASEKIQVPAPSALRSNPGIDNVRVVRQGEVRVTECGLHPRHWFRKAAGWLTLSETQLTLHPSETKNPRSCILLSEIALVERQELVPFGLTLRTKDARRYLLTFENDNDLYTWQDDISSRSTDVGSPCNFAHEEHASVDPVNGKFTGLPHGWAKVLYRENEVLDRENETPRSSVEKTLLNINLKIFPVETHLTSVTVTPEMQIQDVLKLVCWKMRFQAPEYTLAIAGGIEALEMERTVADLEGKRELVMVKRRASTAIPNEA